MVEVLDSLILDASAISALVPDAKLDTNECLKKTGLADVSMRQKGMKGCRGKDCTN